MIEEVTTPVKSANNQMFYWLGSPPQEGFATEGGWRGGLRTPLQPLPTLPGKDAFTALTSGGAEAAPNCTREEAAPLEARGVWQTYSCDAPHVPRKLQLPGGKAKCGCLLPEDALSDPDDELAPRMYRDCEKWASQCTIRTR